MKRILFVLIIILLAGYSCKKNEPDPGIPAIPTKATLVFPYMNSLCNQGTNITALESTLQFEWTAGDNTDSYELNIENLDDNTTTTYATTATTQSVTLSRGTPYAWFVVSISDQVEERAQSDMWRFYIAGESVQNYAPFPAEIISPAMASSITAATGLVALDWNGDDVDGDIISYDVYFGTATPPGLFQSGITETQLVDVAVTSNTIYFWKVITLDSQGNTSDSGEYQFKIL